MTTTLSLLLSNAIAGQTLVAKPGETLSAVVSRTEPTMIKIQGHQVRRIFGKKGDFTLSPDKVPGGAVAYLTPTTDKPSFSVFVSDENGRTWTLLLSVQNTLSDIILIKETADATSAPPQTGHQLPRESSIKQMLLSLISNNSEDAQDVNEIIPLWAESTFVKVKVIKGNSLLGEKYVLRNISKKPMVIDERELYRKGVVSIAVDQPNLQPTESTAVYVISNDTEAESTTPP